MASEGLRNRRILVVEDEFIIAADLQHRLERVGAVVIGPASSVERALALIASEPDLDAAVLDMNLGGKMAYPVADALADRRLPFVFASGYGEAMLRERHPNAVNCDKPYEFRALAIALEGVMSSYN
ncbi:MAG TPA: response regulator [Roseiarcus sp.]|jgi:CheY-like chemotaxis protein